MPQQKVERIQKMCKELFDQKSIADWGLELEMNPITMKTEVLAPPKILKN